MAQTYVKGNLYQISIIDFKPDPNQPRKVIDPEALAELAASIRQHGILQPLLFRVAKESAYLLIVSGERRFLAAKQAGLLILPAMASRGITPKSPSSRIYSARISPPLKRRRPSSASWSSKTTRRSSRGEASERPERPFVRFSPFIQERMP